jgi:hypothetical protein
MGGYVTERHKWTSFALHQMHWSLWNSSSYLNCPVWVPQPTNNATGPWFNAQSPYDTQEVFTFSVVVELDDLEVIQRYNEQWERGLRKNRLICHRVNAGRGRERLPA